MFRNSNKVNFAKNVHKIPSSVPLIFALSVQEDILLTFLFELFVYNTTKCIYVLKHASQQRFPNFVPVY